MVKTNCDGKFNDSNGSQARILHVLSSPRAEGTPNLVLDWLQAGTHWQGVIVLHSQPADLTGPLRSAAHIYEEHELFRPGYRKFLRIVSAIRNAVRKHRPDLLLCWPTGMANWVSAGARLAGCRRLLVHAGNPPSRGFLQDWLTRYVTWPPTLLGAKVACCSNYVRDQYRAVPWTRKDQFQTIYNCTRAARVRARADSARTKRPADGHQYGIMVATLEAHKDHATLLEALPMILKRLPDFRLRLVGDGSLASALKRRARDFGVSEAAVFLGSRRDVPELLGQADCFVFSTTPQEGLGSVLLEALAAGLPVIASDVPACHEVMDGGRWGRLVPARDPAVLAEAVVDVMSQPPSTEFLNDAANYAAAFSVERMLDGYLRLSGVSDKFDRRAGVAAP